MSIRRIAEEATLFCSNKGVQQAWLWEEKFAEYIIEYCAKIAEDASDLKLPASTYGDLIRKFKRL